MFLHVCHTTKLYGVKQPLLWSVDTEVAVMGPLYCHALGLEEFSLKAGMGSKRRFIPIHQVAEDLGKDMCLVLPVLHNLSGCYSTIAFSGLGNRWAKTLEKA